MEREERSGNDDGNSRFFFSLRRRVGERGIPPPPTPRRGGWGGGGKVFPRRRGRQGVDVIRVGITGIESVKAMLAGKQRAVRAAAVGAINDLAFEANAEIKRQMQAKFKGGATRYSLAAFKVERATPENLAAVVGLRADSPGKSRPYDKVLGHLFTGGTRRWKRMEGAFRNIGVLPSGYIMTVPRNVSWANPLDSFGNPKASLIVQLISYFNAAGEQGYRANMTDKRRKAIGKRKAGVIRGVEYFISRGPGMWYGRQQRLAAGIWAKRGTHGSDVAPVFLFVRAGAYGKVIDLDAIGRAIVGQKWDRQFNRWLSFKLRGAR